MKYYSLILGICFLTFQAQAIISAGTSATRELNTAHMEKVPVTILADYRSRGFSGLIDLGTYTHIDDEAVLKRMNARYDGHSHKIDGACSSFIKEIETQDHKSLIMGRNMDLPNSLYPAFILRTNIPGKYRSVNLGYITSGIQTFNQIVNDGALVREMYDVMPYLVTDTMNEKGLIIETNMRNNTPDIIMSGTNPDAPIRISSLNVSRYLSDHASNIEEALNLVNTLDIYSPQSPATSWHFALAMMDNSGRYGVLEFIDNKPVWHEKQPGQTNFWIDKNAYRDTDSNIGLGRWDNIIKSASTIQNQQDLHEMMKTLWYSQLFSLPANKTQFDIRSEQVGLVMTDILGQLKQWIQKYNLNISDQKIKQMETWAQDQKDKWTTTYCLDDDNKEIVEGFTDFMTEILIQLPLHIRQTSGLQESSVISYTVDNKELTYHVQFFEQPEIFDISLDKTQE